MPFVRRREFIVAIALLLFLVLFMSNRSSQVVAEPIYDPAPIVYTPAPQPIVTITPTPVYTPCRTDRVSWRRPRYQSGQPLRNLFRFLFTPRVGRC